MGIVWNKRPTDLSLTGYAADLKAGVAQLARQSALAMEAEAMARAPWRDDTGAARGGLIGTARMNAHGATITLAHSVEYGQFLELRWPIETPPPDLDGFDIEFLEAGRYAILWPTIEAEIPRLRAALQQLLGGV